MPQSAVAVAWCSRSEAAQTQGVGDDAQAGESHRGRGDHGVEQADRGERQSGEVVSERPAFENRSTAGSSAGCASLERRLSRGAVARVLRKASIVRWVTATRADDLTEIDRGGRRCAVCRSGRHWRKLEVVRPEGGQPVVMCAACRARYGDAPPVRETRAPAPPAEPTPPVRERAPREREDRVREDRVKKALRELPRGEHSTGRIAKAAGLNHAKTLRRLRQLEASGGVREVGKRWSTEPPSSDLEGALDRLQARTSNIRIVRDRSSIN